MHRISKLESAVNWLSDRDWFWWPVLFLRPARNEPFSWALIIGLSFFGSLVAHSVVLLLRHLMHKPFLPERIVYVHTVVFLFSLLLYYIHAKCWNSRASRLKRESDEAFNVADKS